MVEIQPREVGLQMGDAKPKAWGDLSRCFPCHCLHLSPSPETPLFSPALGTLASSTPHGMPEQPGCHPVPGPKYVVLFSCPQG